MSKKPPARPEYSPRLFRSAEFFALLQSPGEELYDGRLYRIGSDERIIQARSRITSHLRQVLDRDPMSVFEPSDSIQLDDYNALLPDILATKGHPIELRTISIVVEFEREGGSVRYRDGRSIYLDHGVYAHWLVNIHYGWIEVSYRSGEIVLYNVYDDLVPVIVDDLVLGEIRLADLIY